MYGLMYGCINLHAVLQTCAGTGDVLLCRTAHQDLQCYPQHAVLSRYIALRGGGGGGGCGGWGAAGELPANAGLQPCRRQDEPYTDDAHHNCAELQILTSNTSYVWCIVSSNNQHFTCVCMKSTGVSSEPNLAPHPDHETSKADVKATHLQSRRWQQHPPQPPWREPAQLPAASWLRLLWRGGPGAPAPSGTCPGTPQCRSCS